ncbi:MAG: esterase family protein [Clostridia bacterium]|nr:esterase family protein [Clostridia bacterium]
MKKLLAFALSLCLLFSCLPVLAEETGKEAWNDPPAGFDQRQEDVIYGTTVFKTYLSTTTKTFRKCLVILPPDYTAEKDYPVLYLLHGIGGDHSEWSGGRPDVVIGNLIAQGLAPEMIVVMPNVRARSNDMANPSDVYSAEHFAAFDNFINDLTNDLMPFIAKEYSVAEGRENTAVAGLSMGGREALYIGLTLPETFGYVGAFCPAPGVLPYYAEGGLFQMADFHATEGLDSYILINAGRWDGVVGEWPETYANTLMQNGTDVTFYITEGGHDFTVWKHGLYNFALRIFD